MANKERGIFRLIITNFIASLKPAPRPRLIGQDYFGTKYYEQEKRKNGSHNKNHRYFVPSTKEDFEQEIPAEWEAWLRFRRQEPPTDEEMSKNFNNIIRTKENARKVNEVHLENTKLVEDVYQKQESSVSSFPVYKEYKNEGQNYKLNVKK